MDPRIARLRPGPFDIHTHVVPDGLVNRVAKANRPRFEVESSDEPRLVIDGKALRRPAMPSMRLAEPRLKAMEEQGVAAQLVSPWIALVNDRLGDEDGLWLAETVNESIAEFVEAMPDRFAGIGSAPLAAPERTAKMLRPIMRDLGLLGVEINTRAGADKFLDDPSLEPFWAEAEALGALVFIHPSLGGTGPEYARFYMNNLVHNPLETTFAASHLIFGGVMERYPRLKILLAHGGGFLPVDLGRLKRGRLVRAETSESMSGPVEESFQRFYFDTVTHSASALKFLVGEAGAEHVLLGSDYPFDMGDPDPVRTVREAELDASAESLVLRGTAERVLGAD
jgi:aminocarboxymuconate-semialdehyde decarboxylase